MAGDTTWAAEAGLGRADVASCPAMEVHRPATVRQPPRHLADGDEFEVRIESTEALRNRFHAEKQR